MDIEAVKMGERGQIVIPQDFRKELKLRKGEKMMAVMVDNKIVLEPVRNLKAKSVEGIREDLLEMKICSDFWDYVKAGKPLIRQSKDEFLKELEKW